MLTDLQPFLGRFHPLVVHLPIGFLLLAGLVELLGRHRRLADTGIARLMPVLLGLSALATLGAIVTGTLLAGSGSYDPVLVGRHQQWGWVLGCVVALAAVAAWWRTHDTTGTPTARRVYAGALLLALVLVGVTGHLGGALTHGETYLTEFMPSVPFFSRARASADRGPVDLTTTPVFASLVAPTLEARCVSCHGPAKQSGALRLDSPEAIRKGGDSGAPIVAGNAAASLLVQRIFLPPDDRKAMPPKGHPAPTHAEVALLRWWIDAGASFDQMLADATVTPELETAIAHRLGPVDFSAPSILSVRVPAADPAALDALRALKLRVEPLRAESSLLVVQAPPEASAFDDEGLKRLEAVAAQVAWLDLGGTAVTDAGLTTTLPTLVNLWRLSLDRTAVTDRALQPLDKLARLEAVNLYGTRVTDAGLTPLAQLPRLRSIYAWQTQVTPAGAEALQTSAPRVRVNLGAPSTPAAGPTAEAAAQTASGK